MAVKKSELRIKNLELSKKTEKNVRDSKRSSMAVPMYSLAGTSGGELVLPKDLFGVKVNKNLLAQAMRVYITNRSHHFSNTKTRGEVRGTTKKMYKQKGTGNARHGAATAPIFVGGGIALGPKYRKTVLELPKRMKKLALISALSDKLLNEQVIALANLEKASGKTKEFFKLFTKLQKKSALVVGGAVYDNVLRGVRNIEGISFLPADQLNAYEVISHQSLILTKDAVEVLEKRLLDKGSKGSEKQEARSQSPLSQNQSQKMEKIKIKGKKDA